MNNSFITVRNGNFIYNSNVFRFIGCNMYELANVDSSIASLMIKDAYEEGFQVIRFWAFEPVDYNKLKEICDQAEFYKLKLIPVLADTWGYLQDYKIDKDWYKEGFKSNYLSYVKDITRYFKNRNEIMLWELINEPASESFSDIYNFVKVISETVRTIDPDHLLSLGTIGGIGDKFGNQFSRFNVSNFKNLYSLKTLDAISIHDYSFNSNLLERLDIMFRLKGNHNKAQLMKTLEKLFGFFSVKIDKFTIEKYNDTFNFPFTLRKVWNTFNNKNLIIAEKLNKPLYIGEVGFKKEFKELRKKILSIELKKYFDIGVSGVLLWSFESRNKSLDGHDYGFDINDGFDDVIKEIRI